MVRSPTAREIRADEYKMCSTKYSDINRSLRASIAGVIFGNGMLLTVFQTTFPRESINIQRYLTPEHPGFLIVQVIPNVGVLFSVLLVVVLMDWVIRRNKVLDFGLWLESNLGISRDRSGHGFFTNIADNKWAFIGRVIVAITVATVSLLGWL